MRVLATFVLMLAAGADQAAPHFSFPHRAGPFPVGFKAVHQYDHARAYRGDIDPVSGKRNEGEQARPVQTLVWYPATASGKPMVYGDYLRLTGSEDDFTRSEAQVKAAADSFIRREYLGESGVDKGQEALAGPMRARAGAAAAGAGDASFPVVIYSPSLSAPGAENADLCEYLASHGYIVIASPGVGTHGREMTVDLSGAETQAADIAFLVRYAHSLPQADVRRIAVAGYSWGGLANVLAAAKDRRIRALVSLDGTVRYNKEVLAAATYVTPASVSVPMLYVAARPQSLEEVVEPARPASTFLNDVKHADLYKLTMYPMEHFAFSSTYLRFASEQRFGQYSRADVNRAHGWTADYVLRFLDAYLKDDRAAKAWLTAPPSSHGMPAYAVTMEARPATPKPPGRLELAAELARRGFEHAHAAWQGLRARDAAFAVPERELNEWGYALLRSGEPKRAIHIFRLATLLYPDSANAFDSLADAYEQDGDKTAAIDHYRRSLRLDPGNKNAEQRLGALIPTRATPHP